MVHGDLALPGRGGCNHGQMGDLVDLAGQALGGLEHGLDGVGIEDRDVGGTGEREAVTDIGFDLVAGETGAVVTDGAALGERSVYLARYQLAVRLGQ